MIHLFLGNLNSHNKFYRTVEVEITQERLRQARYSFNLALAMTAACTAISLIGVGLLLIGKLSEGVIATASGVSPIIPCIKFAHDANDRLDKILKELKDDD